ncbi:hypothetical protein [Streptomyces sviceus]|uniref:hypothetical protein n=1 Tax=Streptomyces sviceus TaxID=285530 RepID=UPI0036E50EFC
MSRRISDAAAEAERRAPGRKPVPSGAVRPLHGGAPGDRAGRPAGTARHAGFHEVIDVFTRLPHHGKERP